ncbi:MAG: carbohydrate kinase family protein [bacterium]|nr:carbohydrate kinase family protein [bacterium]
MDKRVVVIGASNIDIKGRSRIKTFSKTKNPGNVEFSPGGVARNIAENLAKLGVGSVLLSAIGNEGFAEKITETTAKAGVDMSRILRCEQNSGIFLAVINSRGELDASISDMSILSEITPEYINANIDIIEKASYIVVDADIPDQALSTILSIAKRNFIPICVEPVSPARAHHLGEFLQDITLTTPNKEELESMVGRSVISEDDIKEAGDEIIKRGVKNLIVTLGSEGAYCVSKDFKGFIPSIRTMTVNSVGAGDALVSGTVAGILDGRDFQNAVKLGIACATITLMDEKAVAESLTMELAEKYAEKIQN